MIEKENCIHCGGSVHGTPGRSNGYPCGFCDGSGLVLPEVNWGKPEPQQRHSRRSVRVLPVILLAAAVGVGLAVIYNLFISPFGIWSW